MVLFGCLGVGFFYFYKVTKNGPLSATQTPLLHLRIHSSVVYNKAEGTCIAKHLCSGAHMSAETASSEQRAGLSLQPSIAGRSLTQATLLLKWTRFDIFGQIFPGMTGLNFGLCGHQVVFTKS